MRIVFSIPSLGKGGAERVVSNLANYFSKNNNNVLILVNNKNNIEYELNSLVKIVHLDENKNNLLLKNFKRINKTKKIINDFKADAVITFLPMPSFRMLILKKKLNCKIIVSDRNNPAKEYSNIFNKLMMKTLYPKADGFVFQTNEQKEFFVKKIQDKSIIIPNPIKEEFLSLPSISNKKNIIINVGRLVEQKNQKLLISAFNNIKDKFPDYTLKIYGEGPLKKQLQDYIFDLNLNDKVELCGVVDNIKEKLDESKVFVLSSNYEGLPNALLEAMSCGLTCISTDCPCGGPKELIRHGENGFLFEINNEIELSKLLETVLSKEGLMKKIGNNALKIKRDLAPNIINSKWESYIKSVIEDE